MIFLVSALYREAKPIIEKYKLRKYGYSEKFPIYKNENITVIISGVGKVNSAIATTYLLSNHDPDLRGIYICLGYCGSVLGANYSLGKIIIIHKITDNSSNRNYFTDIIYKHDFMEDSLVTCDKVVSLADLSEDGGTLFDMEASGFYLACNSFLKRNQIFVAKVISDFIDDKARKEIDFDLMDEKILEAFDFFYELAQKIQTEEKIFTEEEEASLEKIKETYRFTETLFYDFLQTCRYIKLKEKNLARVFNFFETREIKEKKDGKKYFRKFKEAYLK